MGVRNRIDLTPGMPLDERVGTEVIAPGNLLILNAGNTVSLRGAGAAVGPLRIAVTAPGRGIGVGETYKANETVRFCVPAPGEKVQVVLADGDTIALTKQLHPAANGQVSGLPALGIPLLQAEEAVTTSGATALIECRVTGLSEHSAT